MIARRRFGKFAKIDPPLDRYRVISDDLTPDLDHPRRYRPRNGADGSIAEAGRQLCGVTLGAYPKALLPQEAEPLPAPALRWHSGQAGAGSRAAPQEADRFSDRLLATVIRRMIDRLRVKTECSRGTHV